jgi:hypothetical protein
MAVASWERLPFLILFGAFAALELLYTVRAFVRQRTQYSLLHLFIATTCAAIFAGLCRWFGMAMAVVAGVGAGAAVIALFALEWTDHNARQGPPTEDG